MLTDRNNEFNSQKAPFLKIIEGILQENKNHLDVKNKVKSMQERIQNLTYTAFAKEQSDYLHQYGKYAFENDVQLFEHIGEMLNKENNIFTNKVLFQDERVKLNEKPQPQPQPEVDQQMMQDVEYVMSNVDLPLSLYKRSDNYWSIDNPKTLEANQKIKKMQQKDNKHKKELRKKMRDIQAAKQKAKSQTIDLIRQEQQYKREQRKAQIQLKIQSLKQNKESRARSISQSLQFMKQRQRNKPLYKQVERQYREKVQMPILQEKKRRLYQMRRLKGSVPLQEIQSHRERYEKVKSMHQAKTIFTEAPQVSFKSHFYQEISQMSSSRMRYQMDQSNLSLHQKQLEYSRTVKENFKPAIDQSKAEQIESRIKQMNKKRARRKVASKKEKNPDSDDSDDSDDSIESESQEEPQSSQSSSQSDSDDSDKPKPQKDDQYQPSNRQRYKMGVNNLKIARKLAAKKSQNTTTLDNDNSHNGDNRTIDFSLTQNEDDQSGQQTVQPVTKKGKNVWVSKYDQEPKKQKRILYKNYLSQIMKSRTDSRYNPNHQNQLIDTSRILNTSRINERGLNKSSFSIQHRSSSQKAKSRSQSQSKSQYSSIDLVSTNNNTTEKNKYGYDQSKSTKGRALALDSQLIHQTNLQNQIRHIEEKAKYQQQLLKFKKVNRVDKINTKMAIDNAVVDTIKARLSLISGK